MRGAGETIQLHTPVPLCAHLLSVHVSAVTFCVVLIRCVGFDWRSAYQFSRCTALNVAWLAVWVLN